MTTITEVENDAGDVAADAVTQTAATTATPAPVTRAAKGKEEVENELFETISKNAKYRNRIKELEAEVQRGADLANQVTELKTAHRVEVAKAKIETLAIREGILDPVALAALDTTDLKFDENGKPVNLSEVLSSFKTKHPSLFGSASTSSTADVPPVTKTVLNATDMSKSEFDKDWDSL